MKSHCQWGALKIWEPEQQPTRLGQWTIASIKARPKSHRVLDVNYEKANLRAITKEECLNHLSATEKNKLLKLLQEFEELFDGTLGDWDCNLVLLQLKEGAQPYHGRPFPIPKKHVETLKNEIQRLCDLGVLKWQADSEWALPTFIIPKKQQHHMGC